jgi:hypothetical protein
MMFKYSQRDKEDYRLTPTDVEVYAKQAKASYHASLRLSKLGVAAKGVEEFKQAWKYR